MNKNETFVDFVFADRLVFRFYKFSLGNIMEKLHSLTWDHREEITL